MDAVRREFRIFRPVSACSCANLVRRSAIKLCVNPFSRVNIRVKMMVVMIALPCRVRIAMRLYVGAELHIAIARRSCRHAFIAHIRKIHAVEIRIPCSAFFPSSNETIWPNIGIRKEVPINAVGGRPRYSHLAVGNAIGLAGVFSVVYRNQVRTCA